MGKKSFKQLYESCEFRKKNSLEERISVNDNLKKTKKNHFPIFILDNDGILPEEASTKMLVPSEMTLALLQSRIRTKNKLTAEQAIHSFVWDPKTNKSTLPLTSDTMGKIYEEHKDEDGFLYIYVGADNAFGTV